jgi:hypothetical protein
VQLTTAKGKKAGALLVKMTHTLVAGLCDPVPMGGPINRATSSDAGTAYERPPDAATCAPSTPSGLATPSSLTTGAAATKVRAEQPPGSTLLLRTAPSRCRPAAAPPPFGPPPHPPLPPLPPPPPRPAPGRRTPARASSGSCPPTAARRWRRTTRWAGSWARAPLASLWRCAAAAAARSTRASPSASARWARPMRCQGRRALPAACCLLHSAGASAARPVYSMVLGLGSLPPPPPSPCLPAGHHHGGGGGHPARGADPAPPEQPPQRGAAARRVRGQAQRAHGPGALRGCVGGGGGKGGGCAAAPARPAWAQQRCLPAYAVGAPQSWPAARWQCPSKMWRAWPAQLILCAQDLCAERWGAGPGLRAAMARRRPCSAPHMPSPALLAGGELFDRILEKQHYSEKDAADTICAIISTVAYCHQNGAPAACCLLLVSPRQHWHCTGHCQQLVAQVPGRLLLLPFTPCAPLPAAASRPTLQYCGCGRAVAGCGPVAAHLAIAPAALPPPPGGRAGVMHRDLKPENFLLAGPEGSPPLKLTDFGLSLFWAEGERLSEIAGSPYYLAPEVLRRSYGKEVGGCSKAWGWGWGWVGAVSFFVGGGGLPLWPRVHRWSADDGLRLTRPGPLRRSRRRRPTSGPAASSSTSCCAACRLSTATARSASSSPS